MDLNHLLFGGAAFAFLASTWSYIKVILWKIITLFIQRAEIHDSTLSTAVWGYLQKNFQYSTVYDKVYDQANEYIRSHEKSGHVCFEFFGKQSMLFWKGWKPIIISGKPNSNNNNNNNNNRTVSDNIAGYITCIRGMFDLDKIIKDATDAYNVVRWNNELESVKLNPRFFVKYIPDPNHKQNGTFSAATWYKWNTVKLLGYEENDLGYTINQENALSNLLFPPDVVSVINEIRIWKDNKEWYKQKHIPWKRGLLVYGKPGTGKTALARAFAKELDLPIFVYNLNELTNTSFVKEWTMMKGHTPCIALIEDVDNVFHGRTNIGYGKMSGMAKFFGPSSRVDQNKKKKTNNDVTTESTEEQEDEREWDGGMLSFDVLLNCLDGIDRSDGIFTIITTNHIEHVDPALGKPVARENGIIDFISTRPGRIDKAVELRYMQYDDKLRMAKKILGDIPESQSEITDEILRLDETPAQFQERCTQLALKYFWNEKQGGKNVGIAG